MNRLTKDYLIDCGCTVADVGKEKYHEIYTEKLVLAIKKLNDLEDIEEELGIDLITLFKALKQQKVYCIIEDTLMDNSFYVKLVFRNNEFQLELDDCHYLRLIDYRKTWALTKEELKK